MPATPPEHLYKYRAVNANALAMLASDRLYLSRVDAFNDPFEFIDLEAGLHPPGRRRRGAAAKVENQHHDDGFRASLRVCSLSEECQDLLMWGHYADRHRGFCIRFDFANEREIAGMLFPVEYRPALPESAHLPEHAEDIARMSTLTKSDKWSYEREWRIVGRVPEEEGRTAELFLSYDPTSITGIIFGVRTSELHKTLIRKLLKDHPHVEFLQAQRRHDQFALEIAPDD